LIWIDDNSEEADFPNSELAHVCIAIEPEFLKALQHFSGMIFVLILVGRVDEFILKVTDSEVVNIGP